MSIARASLIGGPCKTTFGGATIFSKSDVPWEVNVQSADVDTSMHGDRIDESVYDATVKVTVEGWGDWSSLAVILPTSYTQPVIGSRIMTDADVPLVCAGNDGNGASAQILTMIAAGITKLPDLYLGVDKPIFGPMEFTGVVGTGLDMETASSLYTISAGAYSDATFAYTNFKQQRYSAAWTGKTGFTAFQAQDGWTISHDLKLEPVKIQGRTVDFKIIGYQCMAKCAPIGPSQANIDAELRVQGVGNPQGHRLGANGADLVITGVSGVTVTLKNAAMKGGGFRFGNKVLRNGEFAWVSTVGFTTGVASARATFA